MPDKCMTRCVLTPAWFCWRASFLMHNGSGCQRPSHCRWRTITHKTLRPCFWPVCWLVILLLFFILVCLSSQALCCRVLRCMSVHACMVKETHKHTPLHLQADVSGTSLCLDRVCVCMCVLAQKPSVFLLQPCHASRHSHAAPYKIYVCERASSARLACGTYLLVARRHVCLCAQMAGNQPYSPGLPLAVHLDRVVCVCV